MTERVGIHALYAFGILMHVVGVIYFASEYIRYLSDYEKLAILVLLSVMCWNVRGLRWRSACSDRRLHGFRGIANAPGEQRKEGEGRRNGGVRAAHHQVWVVLRLLSLRLSFFMRRDLPEMLKVAVSIVSTFASSSLQTGCKKADLNI